MIDEPFPVHFDGSRFYNPGGRPIRGFLDVLRWKLTTRPERDPSIPKITPTKPPADSHGSELRVTLINHSTVLLQHDSVNILTDPIWSERASPVSWAGPRRRRDPGVRWDDLPRIDLVLLSHNHYDHLDLPTLRRLAESGQSQFVVPSGVGSLLRAHGIGPVHELDWGSSHMAAGVTIHCVPAFHFSARGLFDRNRTLWCGFMLEMHAHRVYFAGDTAFGSHFDWIRERFGSPTVALLPIGAYEPRWFMSPVHMAPDEAVRAHEILAAQASIAIHHGTFRLTDEALDTPRRVLQACAGGDQFRVLDNGQFLTFPA